MYLQPPRREEQNRSERFPATWRLPRDLEEDADMDEAVGDDEAEVFEGQ